MVQPDWPVKPLGELAEVKLGKMLDGSRHKSGRLLPYVRNASVQWGRVEIDDLPTMYFEDDELDRYALQPNDVLVCEGGEPGRAALWDGRIPELKYQKAIHRVRFKVPFEPAMLVYLLQELALGGSLDPWLSGTTIKHLTLQSLLRLPIPVPPLTVQRELVLEIEAERAAVEANRQLAERIETKLGSAVAAIWG